MNTFHQFQILLQNNGIPLDDLGLREVALKRNDALAAVDLLRKASRSISGGDVYFKHGNKIEIAYANWHSDPKADENPEQFMQRSCFETKDYIEKFPDSESLPLFVLVSYNKSRNSL